MHYCTVETVVNVSVLLHNVLIKCQIGEGDLSQTNISDIRLVECLFVLVLYIPVNNVSVKLNFFPGSDQY